MIISFECYCATQWGQVLQVVGSDDLLGNWDVSKALPLKCIAPNKWKVEIEIPGENKMTFEYKYLIKNIESNYIAWEHGENRKFSIVAPVFSGYHIKDLWEYSNNVQFSWTTSAFTDVIFRRDSTLEKKYAIPVKSNKVISFSITAPRVSKNQYLAITGNCEALGNWNINLAIPLTGLNFPTWTLAIDANNIPKMLDYKYVILDRNNPDFRIWESGNNRLAFIDQEVNIGFYQVNEGLFRYPDNYLKGAGVSLPVFSIRTKDSFGVGEFTDLKKVIDWACKTGLKMIQVLPVNDTQSTNSFLDSYPYKAISVFALHPLFLNIFKAGKIKDAVLLDDYKKLQLELNEKPSVDYELIVIAKLNYCKTLFNEKKTAFLKSEAFQSFFKNNANWLVPYAAFSYLRDTFGTSDFSKWEEFSEYNTQKIKKLTNENADSYHNIAFWYFIQYHLDAQLKEASEYGRNNGVVLKGDIPIGISRYSADAWFEPKLYHFDGQAGAPPDDFSADGQNWGFPTYNWEEMAKDHYQWWRNRLQKMAEYFDAYRIDHILGFFRIWEIPIDAVQGILGHFRPAIPLSHDELNSQGIWADTQRFCNPYIRGHFLHQIFNTYTDEVKDRYLTEKEFNVFELKPEFLTQQLIYQHFIKTGGPEDLTEKDRTIMWGLIKLAAEVLLLPDKEKPCHYHPRISMHATYSYQELDGYLKERFNRMYIDYFYHRHEQFWKQQAIEKLPALVSATNMLICGEDLGMIPATVPEVMNQYEILSLEIQRMPKDPKKQFAHPSDAPYMSVCTTSTHDMATVRGWWEEDRAVSQLFYNQQLGKWGDMPYFAEPWVCKEIIVQHLHSPAMWTVFPIQDLLAMDTELRNLDTHSERINEPANPRHYWKYRLHIGMEQLQKATEFNKLLKNLVQESGRIIE